MLNATTNNNTQLIRNYIIAATTVMLMSVEVADMFNNPQRIAQQDKFSRSQSQVETSDRPQN